MVCNRNTFNSAGQFWNIPVDISAFEGTLRDGSPATNRYVINITTDSTSRSYTGWLYDLTWEFEEGPCLYVGNRQSGPIYEVRTPNDGVIENIYSDYQVSSAFSEEDYVFGLFDESMCSSGSGTQVPETAAPSIISN